MLGRKGLECVWCCKSARSPKAYGVRIQRLIADTLNGWQPVVLPSENERPTVTAAMANSFCVWLVFQRTANYDELHGPERFSFVYLSADGAAAYQALFTKITPTGIPNYPARRRIWKKLYRLLRSRGAVCSLCKGDRKCNAGIHAEWRQWLQKLLR